MQAASLFENGLSLLSTALGLGLVIFFHELGHFAVAKWCDVHVERFSIGFGPVIWSRKKGETEYALSAIPFGGYVKMLGQDDIDPSQLSSDEIAEDPRSYSAKPVAQRMAIISAGVIMNVITAVVFFAIAFGKGVETSPSVLGAVQVGYPAWEAGLSQGDQVTEINGRSASSFGDIMRGIALSSGSVSIKGVRKSDSANSKKEEVFDLTLTPNTAGPRRIIGVQPALGLDVVDLGKNAIPVAFAGTPAASASPAFQPGDRIVGVGDQKVATYTEFQSLLAEKRDQPVDVVVRRKGADKGATETIRIAPNPFRTLGLRMDIGRITAIVHGSPAQQAGIEVGDKILRVNSQEIGNEIDPLQLPDHLAQLHGQEVTLMVQRTVKGADPKEVQVRLIPTNKAGWVERPVDKDHPLSVPSIGVAFPVIPTVLKVDPGSPAEKEGIVKGERIRKVEFGPPEDPAADYLPEKPLPVEFDGKEEAAGRPVNWAFVFWMMQKAPTRKLTLTVNGESGSRVVTVAPQVRSDEKWFVPDERGVRLFPMATTQKADGIVDSFKLGLAHTQNSITDIYLTLRNLLGRELSYKELHGPLGIARVAYSVAQQGIAELLLFLGFLSVNLAVLNFLPIPVLDGGHMVFLIWEGITRKRPSEKVLVTATYCGMAFVLSLMMLVLYLDIFVHRVAGN